MALRRRWIPISEVSGIPAPVAQAEQYKDADWFLDKAGITDDGAYVGLWFIDGTGHLWFRSAGRTSEWLLTNQHPDVLTPKPPPAGEHPADLAEIPRSVVWSPAEIWPEGAEESHRLFQAYLRISEFKFERFASPRSDNNLYYVVCNKAQADMLDAWVGGFYRAVRALKRYDRPKLRDEEGISVE